MLLVKICMLKVWSPFPDAAAGNVSAVSVQKEPKGVSSNNSLLFNSDIV